MRFVADSRLAAIQDSFTIDYQRSWLGGEDFVVFRERNGDDGCGSCSYC